MLIRFNEKFIDFDNYWKFNEIFTNIFESDFNSTFPMHSKADASAHFTLTLLTWSLFFMITYFQFYPWKWEREYKLHQDQFQKMWKEPRLWEVKKAKWKLVLFSLQHCFSHSIFTSFKSSHTRRVETLSNRRLVSSAAWKCKSVWRARTMIDCVVLR